MSLSHRAVALQGVGFTPLLVAVQGFANASPFTRAPRGGGFHARPTFGQRPAQAVTARAEAEPSFIREQGATSRPRQTTTYRR